MAFDGQVTLRITDDGMAAYLTLRPSGTGLPAVSLDHVQDVLAQEGVTEGILWERIRSAVQSCSEHNAVVRDLLIAKGKKPRPVQPEHLVFHPRIRGLAPIFTQKSAPSEEVDEFKTPDPQGELTIDFRARSSIFIVQKNMILAVRKPMIDGEFGTSVRGEMVPFTQLNIESPEPGPFTREENGRIYSEVDGRLIWTEKSFGISQVLEIGGDVGYSTGNIRFPGDLILKGRIQDRFSVWVGGQLSSAVTLDCWDVFCGGNMVIKEGIIGRGKAVLKSKGDIHSKFIENCHVDCLGTIQVVTGILNCEINSNGHLIAGDRGKLIGGHFMVKDLIDTFTLGNSVGLATEVSLGYDFVVTRKLNHFKELLTKLVFEKQDLSKALDGDGSPKKRDRYQAVVSQEKEIQEQILQLMDLQFVNPQAELHIRGTLYPGVTIRISDKELKPTTPLQRCRVYLNGKTGSVESAPL